MRGAGCCLLIAEDALRALPSSVAGGPVGRHADNFVGLRPFHSPSSRSRRVQPSLAPGVRKREGSNVRLLATVKDSGAERTRAGRASARRRWARQLCPRGQAWRPAATAGQACPTPPARSAVVPVFFTAITLALGAGTHRCEGSEAHIPPGSATPQVVKSGLSSKRDNLI